MGSNSPILCTSSPTAPSLPMSFLQPAENVSTAVGTLPQSWQSLSRHWMCLSTPQLQSLPASHHCLKFTTLPAGPAPAQAKLKQSRSYCDFQLSSTILTSTQTASCGARGCSPLPALYPR